MAVAAQGVVQVTAVSGTTASVKDINDGDTSTQNVLLVTLAYPNVGVPLRARQSGEHGGTAALDTNGTTIVLRVLDATLLRDFLVGKRFRLRLEPTA